MFDVKLIVQRLRACREEYGIKQVDIARRLGTSPATISRWENERTSFNPTLNQLLAMADIFGVTLTELLSQEKTSASSTTIVTRARKAAKSESKEAIPAFEEPVCKKWQKKPGRPRKASSK